MLDKGSLAVIGHDRAVGLAFGVPVTGLGAMLIWALVHVRYLVGWGNRLITTLRWLWTMLARNRAERVIDALRAGPSPCASLAAMTGAPITLCRIARRTPRATLRLAAFHATLLRHSRGRADRWFGSRCWSSRPSGAAAATPVHHYERRAGRELPVVVLRRALA